MDTISNLWKARVAQYFVRLLLLAPQDRAAAAGGRRRWVAAAAGGGCRGEPAGQCLGGAGGAHAAEADVVSGRRAAAAEKRCEIQ